MTIGIIGLGLIGGSMGIDLKRRGFADKVLGVETDKVGAEAALRMGLSDEITSFEDCVKRSDIVIVAVPVGTAVKMLPQALDIFREQPEKKQIVIDTCSTKSKVTQCVRYHPLRGRFVATHPMAGTEYSGPWAAEPNLFDGRACIFADAEDSDPAALATIERLYDTLNMRPIYMNSDQHDVHTAYVSHISHVTSFALALTVLENADMWVPILSQNRDNVLHVIDTYLSKMQEFRDAIADYDEAKITELIHEANRIKKILR